MVRKLTCNKYESEITGDERYIIELEIGPENGVRNIDYVALTEDEARKIQAWLTEKLPRIEGVPF